MYSICVWYLVAAALESKKPYERKRDEFEFTDCRNYDVEQYLRTRPVHRVDHLEENRKLRMQVGVRRNARAQRRAGVESHANLVDRLTRNHICRPENVFVLYTVSELQGSGDEQIEGASERRQGSFVHFQQELHVADSRSSGRGRRKEEADRKFKGSHECNRSSRR